MVNPELLLTANNASGDALIIMEAGHKDRPVIFVNPAFERLTGYHRDEIIGRDRVVKAGLETFPAGSNAGELACLRGV